MASKDIEGAHSSLGNSGDKANAIVDRDVSGDADSSGDDYDYGMTEPDGITKIFKDKFKSSKKKTLEADSDNIRVQMQRTERTCSKCQIHLSRAYKFQDVFKGQSPQTRCFYDRAEGSVTSNKVFALGLHEISSYEVSTEKGCKLFKYFLPFADVKDDGSNTFKCCKCFAEHDEVRAKSVFLELHGKGSLVSTDYELTKTGNF